MALGGALIALRARMFFGAIALPGAAACNVCRRNNMSNLALRVSNCRARSTEAEDAGGR
jgi:hypothetical protein